MKRVISIGPQIRKANNCKMHSEKKIEEEPGTSTRIIAHLLNLNQVQDQLREMQ